MRFVRGLAIIVFMTLSPHEHAVAKIQLAMHLVQPIIDQGYYALDISYDDAPGPLLRISCIDQCNVKTSYSEPIGDFFLLGGFGDGDTFITLWSGGSVDWIIIYRIHKGIVTKVLEKPSRTLPAFEATPTGGRVIVLHNDTPGMYLGKEMYGNPPGLTKADRAKIRRETTSFWVWNGTTYVPYHGQIVGDWETVR